jgi:hypothetical protein
MHLGNDPLTSVPTGTPFFQSQDAHGSILQIQFRSFDPCVLVIRLSALRPFLEVPENGPEMNVGIEWALWGASNAHLFLSRFSTSMSSQDCQVHGSRLIDYPLIDDSEGAVLHIYDFNPVRHALPSTHRSDEEAKDFNSIHSCESSSGSPFLQHTRASLPCTRRKISLSHLDSDLGPWPMSFFGDDYIGLVSATKLT